MPKIHNCPYCGFDGDALESLPTKYEPDRGYFNFQVFCAGCHMRGPMAETKEEAIKAWNKLSDRVLKGV